MTTANEDLASGVQRCGHVAIIGRPNVGKSTLLNRMLGLKLSITSRRPQTTRHRILGIKTTASAQFVFVDTPGLHLGHRRALNRYLNRAASNALLGVDAAVLVVERLRWASDDDFALSRLAEFEGPVILAVNKIDELKDKSLLLPYLQECAGRANFAELVPISARRGAGLDRLEAALEGFLPAQAAIYGRDEFTECSERFLVSELVREKLTRRLGEELPHRLSVEVEGFEEEGERARIGLVIWVDKPSHKGMVIGQGGQLLKAVGTEARRDAESLLGRRVHMTLWVKVKDGWSDDERALVRLGYVD